MKSNCFAIYFQQHSIKLCLIRYINDAILYSDFIFFFEGEARLLDKQQLAKQLFWTLILL